MKALNKQFNPTIIFNKKNYDNDEKQFDHGFLLMEIIDDIIVIINPEGYSSDNVSILYSVNSNSEQLEKVNKICQEFTTENNGFKGKLGIFMKGSNYYFDDFDIKDPKIDLSTHYNEGFVDFDKDLMEKLEQKSNGLVILHGNPCTGKTNYIRHLICNTNRRTLYIPPNMAEYIANPDFISAFDDYSNSILIIEDAENILEPRSGYSSSAVSNLLNLTDGLLGDCFKITVICTLNSSLKSIDKALLRKGRLIGMYEFLPLNANKASGLLQKNGFETKAPKAMTLAEIYNYNEAEKSFGHSRKIGF